MGFPEIKVVCLVYFTKYALHIFVCFSNYLRYNFMEIKEGDFLIRKVCKKIPLLVNTHQQSSPVETFSEAFLLLTRPFRRSGC